MYLGAGENLKIFGRMYIPANLQYNGTALYIDIVYTAVVVYHVYKQ